MVGPHLLYFVKNSIINVSHKKFKDKITLNYMTHIVCFWTSYFKYTHLKIAKLKSFFFSDFFVSLLSMKHLRSIFCKIKVFFSSLH